MTEDGRQMTENILTINYSRITKYELAREAAPQFFALHFTLFASPLSAAKSRRAGKLFFCKTNPILTFKNEG